MGAMDAQMLLKIQMLLYDSLKAVRMNGKQIYAVLG